MFETKTERVRRIKFIYIDSKDNESKKKIIWIKFRITSGANGGKNPPKLGFII